MLNWAEIDKLEESQKWCDAKYATLKRWYEDIMNSYSLIRLGFLCWYIIVEWGCIDTTGMSEEDFSNCEAVLKEVTEFGINNFADDPEFLWIFGYMITLFPWYFGDHLEWEKKGTDMLAFAHHLKPEDPVITMVCLNGQPERQYQDACQNSKALLTTRFQGVGVMSTYFRQVLNRVK